MNLWALGLYRRAAAKRQFCIGERKSMGKDNGNKGYWGFGIATVLSVMVFLGIMSLFTGKGLFDTNVYNTYALQADSWRQGRLDLGQDYPWLELAIYNGKYYCSFPPFPSYLLFPLTFLWGSATPDFIFIWIIDLIAAVYLYKMAVKLGLSPENAMLETIFLMLGTNFVFVMIDPSVWFMAQTLCFTLSVLSLYCAVTKKGAAALFFWACSVGCRPMQAVFLPVLLFILYEQIKGKEPKLLWYQRILKHYTWGIPAGVVAVSYMVLNFLRFGNVFEFGHNYLPEFIRAEDGQFHINYVGENVKALFRLPEFMEDGRLVINSMGNLNFLIVSPFLLFVVFLFIFAFIKRAYKEVLTGIRIILLSALYLSIVVMHKTMGGWHFGNRYTNDILPWFYPVACMILSRFPFLAKYQVPICIWGICLNVVGTVCVYNGLV